jgi:hypothetical protein
LDIMLDCCAPKTWSHRCSGTHLGALALHLRGISGKLESGTSQRVPGWRRVASSLAKGSSSSHSLLRRCTRNPGQHTWNSLVHGWETLAAHDRSTSPRAMLGEWPSPWSVCLAWQNSTTSSWVRTP